ncbi:MAG: alpha-(1-_3)-arabinofuranosyltransferase family protein, partial [Candidatus Microthrix subdominans]
MSPPEAPEHRTSTATSIGGRVPLRFPRLPLLAWVALATFALAFVAAAISSPGRYVADARFEIYWGTGRYLRSQLSLWDGVRNLGRPNPYFSPVIGAFVGGLRLIGMSPAWAERVLHASMISLGATGAAAVVAQHRPKERTAIVLAALVFGFNPVVAEFLVPSGIFFHYALAPWLVWCVRGALVPNHLETDPSPWRWPARTALIVFAMGAVNSASLIYAFLPAAVVAAAMVMIEPTGAAERRAQLGALWAFMWRAALASAACASAALIVLAVNGPVVGANLSVTELPETVSAHSSWAESLRGLGYWLTYFGGGGTTQPHPSPYVLYPLAAGLSLLVPIVSVVVLVRTRWRGAKTYGWMLLIALVAMVGLYPTEGQYPLSQALSWLYEQVPTSRLLRNGYKAGAGWALASAVLVAIGISDVGTAWARRRTEG